MSVRDVRGAASDRSDAPLTIRVVVLYPELMDVYADRGNLLALRHRCGTLGVALDTVELAVGDPMPDDADLVLIGGGQDREQRYVEEDLATRAPVLRDWVDAGTAALAVCGGFQLFGRSYRTGEGDVVRGVGIFDAESHAPPPGTPRCIGDILETSATTGVGDVAGFENHSGRTYLDAGAIPFALVRTGWGNNGEDGTEGAVKGEAIGTYLHGPVLPKNPALLDRLVGAALRHRYGSSVALHPPMDALGERAHDAAAAVARRRGRRRRRRRTKA